jgi:hypothetical protein
MEPNYESLDPEERTRKLLAYFSVGFAVISLCGARIPIVGIILSVLGFACGIYGMKSNNRKIANIGVIISSLGLLWSLVNAFLVMVNSISTI